MANSTHDGQLLWAGLSAAPIQLLAANLALLEETRFFAVISKKARSAWKHEGDEFAKVLQEREEELLAIPRGEMLLRLLETLRKMCKLPATHYQAHRDLIDLCQGIAVKAVEYQKDADEEFNGESLEELLAHVMQRILSELGEKFEDLDAAKQQEVVAKLQEFIDSLPEDQQARIREELGVEEFTAEIVRRAIISGSLSAAFAIVVNVAGFPFYMGAVSVLAAIAGLVGLTLPFTFYTTLTSMVAVLADPITVTIVLGSLLSLGWWRSEKKIRESLLPMAIVQLATAGATGDTSLGSDIGWRVLVAWNEAAASLTAARSARDRLVEHRKQLVNQGVNLLLRQSACEFESKAFSKQMDIQWEAIQKWGPSRSERIARGDWGRGADVPGGLMVRKQNEVEAGQGKSREDRPWWQKVSEPITRRYKESNRDVAISSLAREIVSGLKANVDIDAIQDDELRDRLQSIKQLRLDIGSRNAEAEAAKAELERVRKSIAHLDEQINAAKSDIQRARAVYPGLGEPVVSGSPVGAGELTVAAPADEELRTFLQQSLTAESRVDRLRRLLPGGHGDLAFGSLTIGDFIYDYARIDPLIIESVDFARATDLGNPLSFAEFASDHAALGETAQQGSINQLQGYVAERLVAQHLSAAGYDVRFPEDSNQAGWDLLVDGQPFQVKCGSSAELVREHAERYSDIPAIVNAELGVVAGEMPGMYVDPQLSVNEVRELTEQGLGHGEALADFELPLIALAVSSAVEVRNLWRGEGQLEAAVANVLANTSGRIAGGTVGKYAGSALGLVLFGPAGSIVGGLTGTVGGGIVGGRLAREARWWLVREESDAVRDASRELAMRAVELMPNKQAAWQSKRETLSKLDLDAAGDPKKLQGYVLYRLDDDLRYLKAREAELKRLASDNTGEPFGVARRALTQVCRASIHPHFLQNELERLFAAIAALEKKLTDYRLRGTEKDE